MFLSLFTIVYATVSGYVADVTLCYSSCISTNATARLISSGFRIMMYLSSSASSVGGEGEEILHCGIVIIRASHNFTTH